ncbi:D-hexose-6-phosphate mutarotase [Aquipuribacter sp. MA13-6]|uniref:D-hexose-6-phosphate mutarotase n=1 Tax=unclassified Aquipuribacter TaxID=2635084 RepID=UPI003EEF235D
MSDPAPSPRPSSPLPSAHVPPSPCTPRTVTGDDGAQVRFCAHGGHVLGWVPAGGVERLWLSRATGCGPGTAVRGGVPVIWPQFAERGGGPRHGIARDRAWTVLGEGDPGGGPGDGRARVRLELRSDAATRVLLPHPFTLTLDVEASGAELVMTLVARNDGVDPFDFTAAMHTYLAVSSTAVARVSGLAGLVAVHNDGSGTTTLPAEPLAVGGPVDLAVTGVAGEVTVTDPVLGDVVLDADGFDSRVVWNPGPDQVLGDVHDGGAAQFVCLEPAQLEPVRLAPGASWSGTQWLRASSPV